MGQKINPHGLRVRIIKDWDSCWYANSDNHNESLNTKKHELKIGKVRDWDSVAKQKIKCQNQKMYNKRLLLHKRRLVA